MAGSIKRAFLFEANFPWEKFPPSGGDADPGQLMPKKDRDVSNIGPSQPKPSAGPNAELDLDAGETYIAIEALHTCADDPGAASRAADKIWDIKTGGRVELEDDELDELERALKQFSDDIADNGMANVAQDILKKISLL